MVFTDSHCHLDTYQPEVIEQIIKQAREKHLDIIVNVSMNLDSTENIIGLTYTYPEVKAAVGVHPWNAFIPGDDFRSEFKRIAKMENIVAVGEIGLDYLRKPDTKETQRVLLQQELSLAKELDLPVNIHCRGAHEDMMNIIHDKKLAGLRGLIHGFTGDSKMLYDWLELGFLVSIGVRGFSSDEHDNLEKVVPEIPLDRLLVETDSSVRGSSTGPLDVIELVKKLAMIRGIKTEFIADITTSNLKRLLKLE